MKHFAQCTLAAAALSLLAVTSAQAQVTLEASKTITNGCSFGAPGAGVLGVSADMKTLSTSLSGGTRPNFAINVTGTAVLSQSGGITWQRGTTTLAGITTTHSLRDAATAGTAQTLPLTYSTSGSRTLYLEVAGTHNTEFMTAGTYKASATFTCA